MRKEGVREGDEGAGRVCFILMRLSLRRDGVLCRAL